MTIRRISNLGVLLLAVLVVGCTSPGPEAATSTPPPTQAATPTPTAAPEPTAPAGPVILQYIGHASFLITAPDGARIVADPYGDFSAPTEIRPFPDGIEADAVTTSHAHSDHSNFEGVQGDPQVLFRPGSYQVGMIRITGYAGDHGLLDGVSTGANTVFVFEIGEVKIVHLGAAGVVTQPDILEAIRDADVITLDAHGDPSHPLDEQMAQMREVGARTVVLTHYSFSSDTRFFGAATLDEIEAALSADVAVVRTGSELEVTPGMPEQVLAMTPLALGE